MPVPQPLPHGSPKYIAASADRLLAYPTLAEFFHPDGTTTPLTTLPQGTARGAASNGREFAMLTTRSILGYLRVIDTRGEVVRDGPVEFGYEYLRSDGTTWSVMNRDYTDQLLFDDNLKFVRALRIDTYHYPFAPIRGRGYYRTEPPSWAGNGIPPFPAKVTEATPGSYRPREHIYPPGKIGLLRGDAEHLYLAMPSTTSSFARVHALPSVEQVSSTLPEPLPIQGPIDREHASIAENANGMSLLVWNEASALDRVGIYAARLSRSGAILDPEPLAIGSGCREMRTAVASDGTDFAVVWGSCAEGRALLVTSSGGVVPSITASSELKGALYASAAFDGTSYFVAWSNSSITNLVRISRDGGALESERWTVGGRTYLALAPEAVCWSSPPRP